MPMDQIRRWHTYPDAAALTRDVVAAIAEAADQSIARSGGFHIVLAGGNTPQAVSRGLSGLDADWSAWHVYFSDERCLPLGDPGRNETMARANWLDKVAIPAVQIHAVPAGADKQADTRAYEDVVAGIERFDLVLLGLGEDGHTAGLFTVRDWAADHAVNVITVDDAPKPPPQRISLSAARLSRAERVWFLVTGEQKREALTQWRRGCAIPAASIQPSNGVDIYTDLDLDREPAG